MVKIKKVFLILSLITLYMAIFAPLGEASATISEKAASCRLGSLSDGTTIRLGRQ